MANIPKIKGAKKLAKTEIVPFTRQLASMVGAGMPILSTVQTLEEQCANPEFKKILAKNKIRYTADADVTPSPDRAYRMLPSDRWKSMLGVSPYDKIAEWTDIAVAPKTVTILMSQHIGAPSGPTVKVGDTVTKGQKIADAREGLSVPQYASIDGRVTFVDDGKIIVERV